jgi:diguanylate cyclase (GGDEF)-like protein
MQAPTIPTNDCSRLASLRQLNILDTPPEERFDRITRIARRLFSAPIAAVTLVDADRQWFKSTTGLSVCETPRDLSFCGHAILGDEPFIVCDTLLDKRFFDNPLVVGEPNIRFYAGYPLKAGDETVGTFCIIDNNTRQFGDEDIQLLRDLAEMVEQELAVIQLATTDHLTALSNRRGFEILARHSLKICKRVSRPASLLFFDLNNFKQINDRYGHAEGDRALRFFADSLLAVFRESDVIGRLGGDEFVVFLTGMAGASGPLVISRLQKRIDEAARVDGRGYKIQFSVGQFDLDPEKNGSIEDLLEFADSAMYEEKKAGRRAGGKQKKPKPDPAALFFVE